LTPAARLATDFHRDTFLDPLLKLIADTDFQITGCLTQSSDFGNRNVDTVLPQAGKHLLRGEMIPQCHVGTDVEPTRIAGAAKSPRSDDFSAPCLFAF
jgi:hypothetical protein